MSIHLWKYLIFSKSQVSKNKDSNGSVEIRKLYSWVSLRRTPWARCLHLYFQLDLLFLKLYCNATRMVEHSLGDKVSVLSVRPYQTSTNLIRDFKLYHFVDCLQWEWAATESKISRRMYSSLVATFLGYPSSSSFFMNLRMLLLICTSPAWPAFLSRDTSASLIHCCPSFLAEKFATMTFWRKNPRFKPVWEFLPRQEVAVVKCKLNTFKFHIFDSALVIWHRPVAHKFISNCKWTNGSKSIWK